MAPLGYRRSTPNARATDSGMHGVPYGAVPDGRSSRAVLRALALLIDRVVTVQALRPPETAGEIDAALVTQPHVSDFLDVVMHDRELEVRLVEVPVRPASPLAGLALGACQVQERSGATVVALRHVGGAFDTNPAPATVLEPGDVIIALGTAEQVQVLRSLWLR